MPLRICAHRGDVTHYPESTLPAFESAVRKGAHQIEFDVWLTQDGQPVVCHDPTLDRTTGRAGRIDELSLEEVREADAGVRRGAAFAGLRVPTLRETLDAMSGKVLLNIHLKGGAELGRVVAEELVATERVGQSFLAAMPEDAEAGRKAAPGLRICNMEKQAAPLSEYVQRTLELEAEFIQLFGIVPRLPEAVEELHGHGVTVNYFGTEDPDVMRQLAGWGLDYVLTDALDTGLEVAAEFGVPPLG